MGFSILHFIFLIAIVAIIFGPKPFHRAGLSVGDFWRNFKRGWEGREDIDITASVKREIADPALTNPADAETPPDSFS